ncbi:hypothetical protein [Thalassotalea hakodatensis]|uniref:hypothetical protein n=1 Tax=Thalassotalea hakodatensis TaxID=3030492 RepID=UPI002573100E|nr:hypothetical protein [Thalassotalea hakodatensis]
MRELSMNEIEKVKGGALFFGAAVGAIAGGANAYADGGDLGDVVAGAFVGGVSGFFGGAGGMLWNNGARLAGSISGGGSIFFASLPSLSRR